MKKNFNESTNNDSKSICSIGGKKKCVTLSTRNCSSKNHEYFSNVSFHFFHFFMWNRAVCIICPSNELEMVAKAMLFPDHHFRESALHMNIDTPFVYTFWNSWCGCVSVFLRRNSSESKKKGRSKFSPNSNFMTSFSSCKNYVNLYDIVSLECSHTCWAKCYILPPLILFFFSRCTCSSHKSHMKTGVTPPSFC